MMHRMDSHESEGWGVDSDDELLEGVGLGIGHAQEPGLVPGLAPASGQGLVSEPAPGKGSGQKLHVKNREEIARLTTMVQCNSMFESLTVQQKDYLFQRMTYRIIPSGDIVIKEGDEGDEMYLVDYGIFVVLKRDESAHDYGVNREVFRYTTSGATFGELSLMYGGKRGATVRAVTEGGLWVVDRKAFRKTLMRSKPEGIIEVEIRRPFNTSYCECYCECYCDCSYIVLPSICYLF